MGSTSNTIFSGNSRFAQDFQAIIDRTVGIASLSLTQMEGVKATLSNQSSALTSLDSKFSSLQTALSAVETALGFGSYITSMSNAAGTSSTILSPSLSSGVAAGTYQIEVTGLGSYSSTLSKNGLPVVANPAATSISSSSTYTLTVNSVNYTVQPTNGTLSGLASAINSTAGANVQATVVNVGTTSAPDYRLSLQSTQLGANTFQLNDGTQNLMNITTAGTSGSYKINGQPVTTTTRTITVAPGLTVNMLAQSNPGDAVTLTVSQSATGVSTALSSFASAYNAVVDEIGKHRGQGGGALAGQSIVSTLASVLGSVGKYRATIGTIRSLADIGVTFDTKGHLNLDTAAFNNATSGNFSVLSTFLGSSNGTTGSGFLLAAANSLNGLEDTTKGSIKLAETALTNSMTRQDDAIYNAQSRIDSMKQNLMSQMAAADALVAGLEQKFTYISNVFQSMQIAAQMYKS